MLWMCARLSRLWLPTLAGVLWLVFASSPCTAITITYDGATNRPTLFEGLGVDWGDGGGTLYYDVAVTWDDTLQQTFAAIFGYADYHLDSRLIAWGDSSKAGVALSALKDALVSDGFSTTSPNHISSYLDVPYGGTTTISGRGVDLRDGVGATIWVQNSRSSLYGTLGFTQWELAAVPEPSTALLLGLGLIGLAGGRKR